MLEGENILLYFLFADELTFSMFSSSPESCNFFGIS